MSEPQITFGMIVLNGEPFILYNLRALYPFAHQIIVVEGACPSSINVATKDGHSKDNTLNILKRFKAEEDSESKVVIVTAEDEGRSNGFWTEKDEMSEAYAKRATGTYLWQVDSDEFYLPKDMQAIIKMLRDDPKIMAVTFRVLTFWGGLAYRTDGFYLQNGAHDFHRLFAWRPGYRYSTHRPPTVVDEKGRNLRDINALKAEYLVRKGIFMYHYELLFPKQVREKCSYYIGAQWTNTFQTLDQWMHFSFFTLSKPFRVHMVYDHISWLERFSGVHPLEVTAMVKAVQSGKHPAVELRQTNDIENLLSSRSYKLRRTIYKLMVPLNNIYLSVNEGIRRVLRKTPLWPILKKIRSRVSGELVSIKPSQVTGKLSDGWKNHNIPTAQRKLTVKQLEQMYQGNVIRHWAALAEAVRFTQSEKNRIIEVGCSTGYHYEVLKHLLGNAVDYQGIDYSEAMINEARRLYPHVPFQVGDATALPIGDGACDVLISGCVLLHVPDYKAAIAESVRVSKQWVIFQKTPAVKGGTRYYTKKAYGVPCVEIHFEEQEFLKICEIHGLILRKEIEIQSGEVSYKTYVFEKRY